jgi:hypothetical protein
MNCFSWENVWRVEAAWVRHEGHQVRIQAGCIQQLQPGASYQPVQYFRARRSFFTQGQWSFQATAVKYRLRSNDCRYCSRDMVVHTVTSLQAGRPRNPVRFSADIVDFFFSKTSSESHTASYTMGTGNSLPGTTAAEAKSWPLSPIQCQI